MKQNKNKTTDKIMKNKKTLSYAAAAALLGFASQAMAVDITIADNLGGAGFDAGARGTGLEDQETEPGTVANQTWDLEAFTIVGTRLYMIGGFDFSIGQVGGLPGDLFIKVGGGAPSGNPLTAGGTVRNGDYYNYTHAVELAGGLGSSATVQTLTADSNLDSVVNGQFRSNPWQWSSGGTAGSTLTSYTPGLTDAQILSGYGVVLEGGSHNVVSVDLAFLGAIPSGTDVWFSYTMQCGNDSLKGQYYGGFRAPDGGATLVLLGMGLSALGAAGRKLRRA